jgi:mannose-6-phosphate isomerase-like protein (cupin superfamily)
MDKNCHLNYPDWRLFALLGLLGSSFEPLIKERTFMTEKFNIAEKFALFTEHWRPKVVASLNGQELKIVKVLGEFPWHTHESEDELFIVWRGRFRVEFRDRLVELSEGEAIVVPHGMEHRTAADTECEILCFEPAETRNTGNIEDDHYTAPNAVRI